LEPEKEEDYNIIHEIKMLAFEPENEASTRPRTHGRSSEIAKPRALALNLCDRGWNVGEIEIVKLWLGWATPNTFHVLDSPLRERKGLSSIPRSR
jgi:hypothetical protein